MNPGVKKISLVLRSPPIFDWAEAERRVLRAVGCLLRGKPLPSAHALVYADTEALVHTPGRLMPLYEAVRGVVRGCVAEVSEVLKGATTLLPWASAWAAWEHTTALLLQVLLPLDRRLTLGAVAEPLHVVVVSEWAAGVVRVQWSSLEELLLRTLERRRAGEHDPSLLPLLHALRTLRLASLLETPLRTTTAHHYALASTLRLQEGPQSVPPYLLWVEERLEAEAPLLLALEPAARPDLQRTLETALLGGPLPTLLLAVEGGHLGAAALLRLRQLVARLGPAAVSALVKSWGVDLLREARGAVGPLEDEVQTADGGTMSRLLLLRRTHETTRRHALAQDEAAQGALKEAWERALALRPHALPELLARHVDHLLRRPEGSPEEQDDHLDAALTLLRAMAAKDVPPPPPSLLTLISSLRPRIGVTWRVVCCVPPSKPLSRSGVWWAP